MSKMDYMYRLLHYYCPRPLSRCCCCWNCRCSDDDCDDDHGLFLYGCEGGVPLLPFDGGHIAIAFYERIREKLKGDGRRYFIDPAKMYPVAVIVVGVLGLLFLSTVYMDVVSPIKL